MAPVVITLTLVRSTKGTHVYAGPLEVMPSVYIQKTALPTPPPQAIRMTIEGSK